MVTLALSGQCTKFAKPWKVPRATLPLGARRSGTDHPRNAGASVNPPPLWDTDACARPVPSGTKQKCKAKVKEESSSVTCHRRLSL